MTMKAARLAIATTMIAAATSVTAITAADASDACGANRACLYGNNDYKWKLSERAPGYGLYNLTSGVNDEMDCWINLTRTNAAGYEYANGGGDCQTFAWCSRDNNVNFANSDEVSSWRTNRGC